MGGVKGVSVTDRTKPRSRGACSGASHAVTCQLVELAGTRTRISAVSGRYALRVRAATMNFPFGQSATFGQVFTWRWKARFPAAR